MPPKNAQEMADSLETFLETLKQEIPKIEAFAGRLRGEEEFQRLWERDSAEALRSAGFDPDARTQVGLPTYDRGPRCDNCITPGGNYCHC